MFRIISPIIAIVIFGLPLLALGIPAVLLPEPWVILLILFLAPAAYSFLFVVVAGLISLPFQRAIVPSRYPRDLKHPVYRARRFEVDQLRCRLDGSRADRFEVISS